MCKWKILQIPICVAVRMLTGYDWTRLRFNFSQDHPKIPTDAKIIKVWIATEQQPIVDLSGQPFPKDQEVFLMVIVEHDSFPETPDNQPIPHAGGGTVDWAPGDLDPLDLEDKVKLLSAQVYDLKQESTAYTAGFEDGVAVTDRKYTAAMGLTE